MLKIFRPRSAKREHQIQSAPMICINYCIQCLRGISLSECGLRVRSAMCDALFTGQMMENCACATTTSSTFLCVLGTDSRL